jgi:hypothetical protein
VWIGGGALMSKTEDWMSPLNRIIWLVAFRKKQTKVTIRDGREFSCEYGHKLTHKVSGETIDLVKVDPIPAIGQNPFVPCGYFNMKTVTDVAWLSEKSNAVAELPPLAVGKGVRKND